MGSLQKSGPRIKPGSRRPDFKRTPGWEEKVLFIHTSGPEDLPVPFAQFSLAAQDTEGPHELKGGFSPCATPDGP